MAEQPAISVLGGGNGGFCATADLALRGYQVRLYESPDFAHTLEPVIQAGGITLRGVAGEGFARPEMVTTDIEAAISGADIILVIVPAMGHKTLARACAPYLKAGQTVVLVPGCFGGALEFRRELSLMGAARDILLAETTTFMYAAKKEGDHGVWARGLKKYLPLAALPACQTERIAGLLKPLYPQIVPARDVLDTSFHNLNHIVHPVAMLLNIGFVESQRLEKWYLYPDGYTPSVGRVGEVLDAERQAAANAYGIHGMPVVEVLQRYYGHQGMNGQNLHELFSESPVHRPALGPKSVQDRLLSEDIPYGLVPLASFGRLAGVPTPLMDSLITLAGAVSGIDYRQEGRTVESLGLEGLSPEEIIDFVTSPDAIHSRS